MKSFNLQNILGLSVGLVFLCGSSAFALPIMQSAFIQKYPSAAKTQLDSCATCHQPAIKGFVNSYGAALQASKMDFGAIETMPSAVPGKTFLEQILANQFPGSQAADPEVFDFVVALGTVHFDHGNHIMNKPYGIQGNCTACHSADPNHFPKLYNPAVSVKAQAHATCIGCHKTAAVATAPTKCMECHKKAN